jgi:hypothetical protein
VRLAVLQGVAIWSYVVLDIKLLLEKNPNADVIDNVLNRYYDRNNVSYLSIRKYRDCYLRYIKDAKLSQGTKALNEIVRKRKRKSVTSPPNGACIYSKKYAIYVPKKDIDVVIGDIKAGNSHAKDIAVKNNMGLYQVRATLDVLLLAGMIGKKYDEDVKPVYYIKTVKEGTTSVPSS